MSHDIRIRRRRLSDDLARTAGQPIDGLFAYPTFHDRRGNVDFVLLHDVEVYDGRLQVVGDLDGCYEWVWFREAERHSDTTAPVVYTMSGWCTAAEALRGGLNYALGGAS